MGNRARCEHCNGCGKFAGHECDKCRGQGFHFIVEDDDDEPPKRRAADQCGGSQTRCVFSRE